MNGNLLTTLDLVYQLAGQKAERYFKLLTKELSQQDYVSGLITDFQIWKKSHIHHLPFFSFFSGGKRTDFIDYLKWLDSKGKLDNYLDRSVSYIFMRDLGKNLYSDQTKTRIKSVVESLKNQLVGSKKTIQYGEDLSVSLARLYREAQKAGIESSIIWVVNKIRTVSTNIPEGMDAVEAERKLIKIIAGVVMYAYEEMDKEISPEKRAKKLDEAIRLGYSYGLTYPYIDDLLDSNVLSEEEKRQFSEMIRKTLINGKVPDLGKWSEKNLHLMQFIYKELKQAFEYIESHLRHDRKRYFIEQAYVFFHSQDIDRQKSLSNGSYSNEELYIPVIVKAASSRLMVHSLISAEKDKDFEDRMFLYGIYNQLADDFADIFEDMANGTVTPFTYYLKYHHIREDLFNPFELYWAVIFYLIHNVYCSDEKTREVILDRAINGLKRFKKRIGREKYKEVMRPFATGNKTFYSLIEGMVQKAEDVDFFDKLVRDHLIAVLKNEREEKKRFQNTISRVRKEINSMLPVPKMDPELLMKEPIIDAANYSLKGDGKRLRGILCWVMGVHEYGLRKDSMAPLVKSLEYMHTASLIFDDLPSQDDAPLRRGRPTLHQVYNVAIAELSGLFLTQKAVEEEASLKGFAPKTVLKIIRYSAQKTEEMCIGQAMDLDSKGRHLTLDELNLMSFYKTGLGFEASLLLPAMLAHAHEEEIKALEKFAFHAGIAFQIKDDLLDVEGEEGLLGKAVGIDKDNNSSTFVTILGVDGAKKAMWDHYCSALETLHEVPRNTYFLKQFLDYIVNRHH